VQPVFRRPVPRAGGREGALEEANRLEGLDGAADGLLGVGCRELLESGLDGGRADVKQLGGAVHRLVSPSKTRVPPHEALTALLTA